MQQTEFFRGIEGLVQPEVEFDLEEASDPARCLQRFRCNQYQASAEADDVLVVGGQILHLFVAERTPAAPYEQDDGRTACELG